MDAKRILSGGIRNIWVDGANRKVIARKRLVKEIRVNLMLRWIHNNFPDIPVVFLMRNPCAVANSWLTLGWNKKRPSTEPELEAILSQARLLQIYFSDFTGDIKRIQK